MQPIIMHQASLLHPTSCGAKQPFPERLRSHISLFID